MGSTPTFGTSSNLGMLERSKMRSALIRLLAVFAALLVLSGGAWARELYVCHMSGRVLSTCCCAGENRSSKSDEPGVRPADCCERLRAGQASKATNTNASAQRIQPAALTAILAQPAYLAPQPPVREFAVRQGRGPPPLRRPLFAVHCAYLC